MTLPPRAYLPQRGLSGAKAGAGMLRAAVMPQGPVASGRCAPAWPKDVLRITFGVIWLIDATLKWLPGFRASYMSVIMGQA